MSATSSAVQSLPVSSMSIYRLRAFACLAFLGLLLSCSTEEPIATSASDSAQSEAEQSEVAEISLRTVSTKPWLISGGDVLVELTYAASINPAQLRISLNGSDVSNLFRTSSVAIATGTAVGHARRRQYARGDSHRHAT